MKVVYMAAPVAGNVRRNLGKAKLWVKWLTENSERPIAVIAPWITGCEIWDDGDPVARAAGLLQCKAVIQVCHELQLVGTLELTDGMVKERGWAIEAGVTVVDSTCLGEFPPDMTPREIANFEFLHAPPITFGGVPLVGDPTWPENRPPAFVNEPELPWRPGMVQLVPTRHPEEAGHNGHRKLFHEEHGDQQTWSREPLNKYAEALGPPLTLEHFRAAGQQNPAPTECEQRGDWCSAHNRYWHTCNPEGDHG